MSSSPLGQIRLLAVPISASLLVVALLMGGLWFAPSPSSALPATDRSSTVADHVDGTPGSNALPIALTTTDSALPAGAPIPESGPQLTAATWRMAIGQAVVDAGATRLGAPYVYSAAGPNAFDCSGFTSWAWQQLGVTLPHNSGAQWAAVERIPLDQLQPGDLVFNWGFGGGEPDHVGLYVGDGIMIHSPNSSGVVRYDSISWWTGAVTAAGRVR